MGMGHESEQFKKQERERARKELEKSTSTPLPFKEGHPEYERARTMARRRERHLQKIVDSVPDSELGAKDLLERDADREVGPGNTAERRKYLREEGNRRTRKKARLEAHNKASEANKAFAEGGGIAPPDQFSTVLRRLSSLSTERRLRLGRGY